MMPDTSEPSPSPGSPSPAAARHTSLEKALDICEALASNQRGASVTDLARVLRQPAPTVHRLLAVLKRRGFVRQDEETLRYSLTLKMLDLSFRLLGRSELRLHAYPVLREYVLRTGLRAFIAVPGASEVTYLWSGGPDEVGMHTTHGREMPVHCALYVDASAKRRLSCLKLEQPRDAVDTERVAVRFGVPVPQPMQRLLCTCAPVYDYTGRHVARVGVFTHAADEAPFVNQHPSAAMELARLISLRLGHLAAVSVA
jgi:IclR family transcriptional regulator, KDG regulon repressor